MIVFVTAIDDEILIEKEGAIVLTTLNIIFLNTEGQLTQQPLIGSG